MGTWPSMKLVGCPQPTVVAVAEELNDQKRPSSRTKRPKNAAWYNILQKWWRPEFEDDDGTGCLTKIKIISMKTHIKIQHVSLKFKNDNINNLKRKWKEHYFLPATFQLKRYGNKPLFKIFLYHFVFHLFSQLDKTNWQFKYPRFLSIRFWCWKGGKRTNRPPRLPQLSAVGKNNEISPKKGNIAKSENMVYTLLGRKGMKESCEGSSRRQKGPFPQKPIVQWHVRPRGHWRIRVFCDGGEFCVQNERLPADFRPAYVSWN